jgi:hypothetical protein
MVRLSRAVAAGAILLATVARPVAAAPPTYVTISGGAMSYADVTFHRRTDLWFENVSGDHDQLTVAGGHDYAGVVVQTGDAAHHLVGGGVLVRGMRTRTAPDYPWSFPVSQAQALTLQPGRYRLVVVADAPATVRVRSRFGLPRSLALRASGHVGGIHAHRADMATMLPPVVAADTSRAPFHMYQGGYVTSGFFESDAATVVAAKALCVRRPADPATPCDDGYFVDPVSLGSTSMVSYGFHPGDLAPGDYAFDFTSFVVGADVRDRISFVLELEKV